MNILPSDLKHKVEHVSVILYLRTVQLRNFCAIKANVTVNNTQTVPCQKLVGLICD